MAELKKKILFNGNTSHTSLSFFYTLMLEEDIEEKQGYYHWLLHQPIVRVYTEAAKSPGCFYLWSQTMLGGL